MESLQNSSLLSQRVNNNNEPLVAAPVDSQKGDKFLLTNEGRLILPNGKILTLKKLVIDGVEQKIEGSLTEPQVHAIKKMLSQIFSQMNESHVLDPNVKKITIEKSKADQVNVSVKTTEKTTIDEIKSAQITKLFTNIAEQFRFSAQPLPPNLSNSEAISQLASGTLKSSFEETDELDYPLSEEAPLATIPAVLEGENQISPATNVIKEEYVLEDGRKATELITRDSTLDRDIAFLESSLKHLNEKLEKQAGALTGKEEAEIGDKIRYFQQELIKSKEYKENNKDWIHSNAFRDIIKDCKSFVKGIEKYIPVPVNMRYHELKVDENKTVGIYRVGVISDMRNGWISLSDLKEMRNNPDFVEIKMNEIKKNIQHPKPKGIKQKIQAKFGTKPPPLTGSQLESARNALIELEWIFEEFKGYKTNILDTAIQDRKRALERQMIQLVAGQVEKNEEKIRKAIKDGKSFDLVHVGLLNQKKDDLDKTGWKHNELVELEDMKEIFKEFKGKKIIFDNSGPFIDGNEIHLPNNFGEEFAGKEVEIDTFFFNLSVQGNIKNEGFQLENNKEQMNEFLKKHPFPEKKQAELLEKINGKTSGYPVAEDFLAGLLEQDDCAISTGCLSAKDRTGFICARLIQHFIGKFFSKLKNPYAKQILNKDKPASRAVGENTPRFRVLKVNPKSKLRGINPVKRWAIPISWAKEFIRPPKVE